MIYWVLARFGPRALTEIQGLGRKTGKRNFPGTFGGKIRPPPKFIHNIAQLFYICVLADHTPKGRKSQNTGLLGPFGLGQPLGTWRNSGPKTEKYNFPELGALLAFRKKIRPPQKILPKGAQLFYILCFGRTDGQGRLIAKYGGFGHFWPRAAPWH